jgi:hypothetical protein
MSRPSSFVTKCHFAVATRRCCRESLVTLRKLAPDTVSNGLNLPLSGNPCGKTRYYTKAEADAHRSALNLGPLNTY